MPNILAFLVYFSAMVLLYLHALPSLGEGCANVGYHSSGNYHTGYLYRKRTSGTDASDKGKCTCTCETRLVKDAAGKAAGVSPTVVSPVAAGTAAAETEDDQHDELSDEAALDEPEADWNDGDDDGPMNNKVGNDDRTKESEIADDLDR